MWTLRPPQMVDQGRATSTPLGGFQRQVILTPQEGRDQYRPTIRSCALDYGDVYRFIENSLLMSLKKFHKNIFVYSKITFLYLVKCNRLRDVNYVISFHLK